MLRQIHASNINGLGASQVVLSFLEACEQLGVTDQTVIYLPDGGLLSGFESGKGILKVYERILPNAISRFIECTLSFLIFKNVPTIVLGDIPLRGIKNQVVLVHQPHLIYPKVNSFSSISIKFKINRFLFKINHKYARKIVVQTGVMAKELIASYPEIKDKVIVIPQPVPAWLITSQNKNKMFKKKIISFFYPSAFYPHKQHDFLLKVNHYLLSNDLSLSNIEVWLTLHDSDFHPFNGISWIRNLGVLNPVQMNHYYKEADALLFLSSMESYGLPLVEALTLNMPIITVALPYSKWMCGNEAFYFKPFEENSFYKAINACISSIQANKQPDYSQELGKFPASWKEVALSFTKELE